MLCCSLNGLPPGPFRRLEQQRPQQRLEQLEALVEAAGLPEQ